MQTTRDRRARRSSWRRRARLPADALARVRLTCFDARAARRAVLTRTRMEARLHSTTRLAWRLDVYCTSTDGGSRLTTITRGTRNARGISARTQRRRERHTVQLDGHPSAHPPHASLLRGIKIVTLTGTSLASSTLVMLAARTCASASVLALLLAPSAHGARKLNMRLLVGHDALDGSARSPLVRGAFTHHLDVTQRRSTPRPTALGSTSRSR